MKLIVVANVHGYRQTKIIELTEEQIEQLNIGNSIGKTPIEYINNVWIEE